MGFFLAAQALVGVKFNPTNQTNDDGKLRWKKQLQSGLNNGFRP
jgi:hypothetical protein